MSSPVSKVMPRSLHPTATIDLAVLKALLQAAERLLPESVPTTAQLSATAVRSREVPGLVSHRSVRC